MTRPGISRQTRTAPISLSLGLVDWDRQNSYGSNCSTEAVDQGLKRSSKPSRIVTFSEKIKVQEIEQRDEIDDDHFASVWYTPDEWDGIKEEYNTLVFLLDNGQKVDEEKHSIRGLEIKTEDGAWDHYQAKKTSHNVVLDEQDRQKGKQVMDFFSAAKEHIEHSRKCLESAISRAQKDREAIKDYLGIGIRFEV